jgi:hypothetical protein
MTSVGFAPAPQSFSFQLAPDLSVARRGFGAGDLFVQPTAVEPEDLAAVAVQADGKGVAPFAGPADIDVVLFAGGPLVAEAVDNLSFLLVHFRSVALSKIANSGLGLAAPFWIFGLVYFQSVARLRVANFDCLKV